MLAEQEVGVLDAIRPLLELAGYRVVTAGTGVEALEALRHGLFELLIASADLPMIDGLQVVKKMRADKLNRDVPAIVIVAGPGTPEAPEKTLFIRKTDIDIKLMPMVRKLTRKD